MTVSVGYDGQGRLTSYARSGATTLTHGYNGLDDRVSTTTGSDVRRFVYDADGRLLGEYGTSVTDVKAETIWLSPMVANDNAPFGGDDGVGGYAPLVVATGGALYWVHGNHLGVPVVTTNSTGAAATPSGYTRVGFPGQTQTLSDLYYNRYRDYDSNLGRYIQADPIGLAGGENIYTYARANPLRWTDPDGLNPFAIGAVGLRVYCSRNPIQCARLAKLAVDWCGTILEMAYQTPQNEYTRLARIERPNDPCSFLEETYNKEKDPVERIKIAQAQKFLKCRNKRKRS